MIDTSRVTVRYDHMRADRLIAMIMLLKKNGKMTAARLAEELEVSERTIYRDIDALGAAGVPVYAQQGPGGGIALLDTFRTDLTGLTAAEQQALLTLTIPKPLQVLGIDADLKSALHKLAAAVPDTRDSFLLTAERVYIDDSQWSEIEMETSLFETIRQALWNNMAMAVTYMPAVVSHAGPIRAQLHPLGLVASSGEWFLAAGSNQTILLIRLSQLLTAEITSNRFERPSEFHLQSFWLAHQALLRRERPSFEVKADIQEAALPYLRNFLVGDTQAVPEHHCWRVILRFETFEEARMRLLGLGSSVSIISPEVLRLSIIDFASQVLSVYERE